MYLKKFLAPIVGLIVADVVSAVQKLVLAKAGIRFAPWRVNRSLHSQIKEVIMGIIKKLVASLVGRNPAGSWSAAKMQSLLLTFILMVAALWVSPAAIAAEKEMVRDPSTGKMVTAPEYGGTISYALKEEAASGTDAVLTGQWAQAYVAPVLEKLAIGDWATPRDEWDFVVLQFPTNAIGALAESWSQPDPLTLVVNVRQGVRWHDKPPMNGRELTADDVVFNFHRITGMGSGFTELSEWANDFKGIQFESIEATDEWTVVFRLKEISLSAPAAILDGFVSWIYPPEVIKEHGDAKDWRNLVGTGPMMLADWTKGSSFTWEKNPDYWHNDEKYPENPLPYIDRLRALIMPEVATYLAAMRTGIWWGWAPPMELVHFTKDPLGNLAVFLIPSLILGTASAAATMRMMRTMMEVLRQDYIRTAWSKGLRERVVIIRHSIKNALIPVITLIGLQLPILVGGAVIMENIFNLPGLGRLLVDALQNRDYPMVSGVNLFFATGVVGLNLLIDLIYPYLDPRVRYE